MRSGVALLFAFVFGSGVTACGGADETPATPVAEVPITTTTTEPEAQIWGPALSPAHTAAPSPQPVRTEGAGLGRAASVVAVKDAAVAAGYACPGWVQDDVVTHADESGHCSSGDVFVWYATERRFMKGHEQMLANKVMIEKTLHTPANPLLVGPNWMITSKGAPALQPQLGGKLE